MASENQALELFGSCDGFKWRNKTFNAALLRPRSGSLQKQKQAVCILCQQGLPINAETGFVDVSHIPGVSARCWSTHYLSTVSWFLFLFGYLPCAILVALLLSGVHICRRWKYAPEDYCHKDLLWTASAGAGVAVVLLALFKAFQLRYLMRPSRHTQALYLAELGLDIDDEDWDPEAGNSDEDTSPRSLPRQQQQPAFPTDDVQVPLLHEPHQTHQDAPELDIGPQSRLVQQEQTASEAAAELPDASISESQPLVDSQNDRSLDR